MRLIRSINASFGLSIILINQILSQGSWCWPFIIYISVLFISLSHIILNSQPLSDYTISIKRIKTNYWLTLVTKVKIFSLARTKKNSISDILENRWEIYLKMMMLVVYFMDCISIKFIWTCLKNLAKMMGTKYLLDILFLFFPQILSSFSKVTTSSKSPN